MTKPPNILKYGRNTHGEIDKNAPQTKRDKDAMVV